MRLASSARVAISFGCWVLAGCAAAASPRSGKTSIARSVVPLVSVDPSLPVGPEAEPQAAVRRVEARPGEDADFGSDDGITPDPRTTLRPPFLVPVLMERQLGYLLAEGDVPTRWWFVKNWRRVARDLFVADVLLRPERSPALVLFDPRGHVALLDATDVVTADANVGLLLAKKGDEARAYTFTSSRDALSVTPMELPGGAVNTAAWSYGWTRVMDASHVLLGDQSIIALPSLEKVAIVPGRVDAIAGSAVLADVPDANGIIGFVVLDGVTGAVRKKFDPPSPRYGVGAEGSDWMVALSERGRMVAFAEPHGIWTLDLSTTPSQWKLVSAKAYTGGRFPATLSIAADESFVCFGERGVNTVVPIAGRPPIPAGRIEVPLEGGAEGTRTCELAYLPTVPGLSPVAPDVYPNAGVIVRPRLFDEELAWSAAVYEAPSRTAAGALELVVADRSGALVHRAKLGATPESWRAPGDQSLSVVREAGTVVRVTRGSGADARSTQVDVVTGTVVSGEGASEREAEGEGSAPAPPEPTPYCLHPDGSLTAASTCED
ncbi:MAG: hypothetical protein U0414_40415 [Polyangiaceae bacterium]